MLRWWWLRGALSEAVRGLLLWVRLRELVEFVGDICFAEEADLWGLMSVSARAGGNKWGMVPFPRA